MIFEVQSEQLRQIIREEIRKAFASSNYAEDLISRDEAGKVLGVKSNTLAVWAMKGIGPAPTKIGSCVRYRRSELERFINDNTMPR